MTHNIYNEAVSPDLSSYKRVSRQLEAITINWLIIFFTMTRSSDSSALLRKVTRTGSRALALAEINSFRLLLRQENMVGVFGEKNCNFRRF